MGIQLYRDISVDFSNSRYIIINAKQHDSKSRFIRMTCTNLGQKVNFNPNNYSAFIRYRKPDGYGVFNKCIISTTGEIIFELTEQMLSTVGTSYADLLVLDITKPNINNDLTIISADGNIIENNSSIASTMTFYINILEKPLDDWEITSTNEFSALNDLLLKASKDYEYIVQVTKEYMDNAKNSENSAILSANEAKASADNAKKSESNTVISERKAYAEAIAAFNSALLSKSYAVGESGFLTNESWEKILTDSDDYIPVENRENEAIENAKYYYEQAKVQANKSKTCADNAKQSETNARDSEKESKASEDAARVSETNAKVSETNSKDSENKSKQSELHAKDSEDNARNEMIAAYNSALLARSYTNGDTSGVLSDDEWNNLVINSSDYISVEVRGNEATDNAKYYKEQAGIYANTSILQAANAKTSADNAKASEDAAKQFRENIENYATLAKSYAVGNTNTRENEAIENAKYYYEQAKQISESLNGTLFPMGTIPFSQLVNQTKKPGYMYNISDDFVSDDNFKDGGNITYPAGTNVYYTADGFWDCLAGSLITPENIGTYIKKETYTQEDIDNLLSNIQDNIISNLENAILHLTDNIKELENDIAKLKQNVEADANTILLEVTDEEVDDEEDNAMTIPQVQEAIATVWNEESSDDETAMNKEEIEYALSHTWDGNTSPDETAMQKGEIADIISK